MIFEELSDEQKDTYDKWNKLVNMSKSELEKFIDSSKGQEAGLSKKDAEGPIKRGRDSARAIVRMLDTPKEKWSSNDWDWAKRQISFISRMTGSQGPLYDEKSRPTRKLLSLLIWGNKPSGFKGWNSIYNIEETSAVVMSFARKANKSPIEVEKIWDQSKKDIIGQGVPERSDIFYPMVTNLTKKKLGLKENLSQEVIHEILT